MQLRSEAICLEEISATTIPSRCYNILNSKLDEIMKLLEKSQEKQPIEDEIASHQFRQRQVNHAKNKTIL